MRQRKNFHIHTHPHNHHRHRRHIYFQWYKVEKNIKVTKRALTYNLFFMWADEEEKNVFETWLHLKAEFDHRALRIWFFFFSSCVSNDDEGRKQREDKKNEKFEAASRRKSMRLVRLRPFARRGNFENVFILVDVSRDFYNSPSSCFSTHRLHTSPHK